MGIYITPPNMSQIEYLALYGMQISEQEAIDYEMNIDDNAALLVLVNNGNWFALGIAFNEREQEKFTTIRDGRIVKYYITPKENITKEKAGICLKPEDWCS